MGLLKSCAIPRNSLNAGALKRGSTVLGSLNNAEKAKRHFFDHPIVLPQLLLLVLHPKFLLLAELERVSPDACLFNERHF